MTLCGVICGQLSNPFKRLVNSIHKACIFLKYKTNKYLTLLHICKKNILGNLVCSICLGIKHYVKFFTGIYLFWNQFLLF